MTQFTILETLRDAFPEPTPAVRTYLDAYEAFSKAGTGMRETALQANRAAWRALTEDERQAVDTVLKHIPLQVR